MPEATGQCIECQFQLRRPFFKVQLAGLELADVLDLCDETGDVPHLVAHGRNMDPDKNDLAAWPNVALLDRVPVTLASEHGAKQLEVGFDIVGMGKVGKSNAGDFT
ncbi:hypothetical protein N7E02_05665 (plasmid) [Aliirhizobium terrae]|nr:hypothetical protein [Rhizobium sp. CC-CFT758]WJH38824.1 hypothetical protein N7E02_05665 [Rhizobium sp. CC-CFT758]